MAVAIIVGVIVAVYLIRLGNNWFFGKAGGALHQRRERRRRRQG
jgi:hypothetical protein